MPISVRSEIRDITHGLYKELNIIIILMMKEKGNIHPIIIYHEKIINSPKPKKSLIRN